ncbi:hypothetical protein SAMN05443575_1744 [Jatrophihabitans endophyticus]|uniref:Uncharacterized protein n=1 Tax=Jatrophihabitans endophyticus TaxID=1206085 RepID=A0A1M5I569_9ACTN|nr:hypothetical protein [Jatrophihabitans endophyticus]SHG22953.1 hypothetical protein SAMN05443575_1744 [Jatrophihabitans endophyticus]
MTTDRRAPQPATPAPEPVPPVRGALRFLAFMGPEGPIAIVRGWAVDRRAAARSRRRRAG